ncbi:MAG TPA: RHS repeat-associated core domain-containing protein [Terracidiphilus sp.]|jgi:RHS repeat-associated protein|nr:RHS repeat-associated core domain-containing protein [Terracidiphilus sp.]
MTVAVTCAIDPAPSSPVVIDSYEYDAFGNLLNKTGSTPNEFLYRGEQYDSDLGLYYLRARYYNPLTGRFMSRDPEEGKIRDPRTLHKYLYAISDPVNRRDPSGRAALVEVDLENAEIGFSSHGLDHLVAEGLELSEPEIEEYIEEVVREYIADVQESGGTVGNIFDLMFTMDILDNIPWAVRVFVVSAADLRVSTYFPQNIP